MHDGGNFVPPFGSRLVIEQHVRIGYSRAKNLRRAILQAYRRYRPEMLAKFDVVEMIFHSLPARSRRMLLPPKARGPSSARPARKTTGLSLARIAASSPIVQGAHSHSGRDFARTNGRTTVDRPFESFKALLCRQCRASSTYG